MAASSSGDAPKPPDICGAAVAKAVEGKDASLVAVPFLDRLFLDATCDGVTLTDSLTLFRLTFAPGEYELMLSDDGMEASIFGVTTDGEDVMVDLEEMFNLARYNIYIYIYINLRFVGAPKGVYEHQKYITDTCVLYWQP